MFDGLLFFLYTWNLMAEHDREVEETEGCQIRSSLIGSELLQVHWNHKYMNFGILVHWMDKLSMIIDALIKDRVILGLEKGKKSQNLVRPRSELTGLPDLADPSSLTSLVEHV